MPQGHGTGGEERLNSVRVFRAGCNAPGDPDENPRLWLSDCAGMVPHQGPQLSFDDVERAVAQFGAYNLVALSLPAFLMVLVTGAVAAPMRSGQPLKTPKPVKKARARPALSWLVAHRPDSKPHRLVCSPVGNAEAGCLLPVLCWCVLQNCEAAGHRPRLVAVYRYVCMKPSARRRKNARTQDAWRV